MTPTAEDKVRFLAEHVMGLKVIPGSWFLTENGGYCKWNPLTVPGDRDMLVNALRTKGWLVAVMALRFNKRYHVRLDDGNTHWFEATADSPGSAVVDAAYEAVKETVK